MEVEIRLDSSRREPKIVIFTDTVTEEIQALADKLSENSPRLLSGFRNGELEILEQAEILRFFASGGKVFAVTQGGEYTLRLRLYEVEQRLDKSRFVRISNSEIINLKKVKRFDLSLSGTIQVSLTNGEAAYVSRRYVSKIKRILGL